MSIELIFGLNQGQNVNESLQIDPKYFEEETTRNTALPPIVTEDHLQSQRSQYSMPLLGMQFLLRHLVRCTEFCLVCHQKVRSPFDIVHNKLFSTHSKAPQELWVLKHVA